MSCTVCMYMYKYDTYVPYPYKYGDMSEENLVRHGNKKNKNKIYCVRIICIKTGLDNVKLCN